MLIYYINLILSSGNPWESYEITFLVRERPPTPPSLYVEALVAHLFRWGIGLTVHTKVPKNGFL